MFRPFNLDQEQNLRLVARDAAGAPALAAVSGAELTLLTLATRISPVQVIEADPGQLTASGGATPEVRLRVLFPCEGVVCSLAFAETETGVLFDQQFQINSTQGQDSALGYDEQLDTELLNVQAFFGADAHRRDVAYRIRSKDDTWSVTFANLRGNDTSHPILQIGFIPTARLGGE